jgi:hypothetical protein
MRGAIKWATPRVVLLDVNVMLRVQYLPELPREILAYATGELCAHHITLLHLRRRRLAVVSGYISAVPGISAILSRMVLAMLPLLKLRETRPFERPPKSGGTAVARSGRRHDVGTTN